MRAIERARAEGSNLVFRVGKVDSRRWNWTLVLHYSQIDPNTGVETLVKVTLRTGKDRALLDLLAEQLNERESARG